MLLPCVFPVVLALSSLVAAVTAQSPTYRWSPPNAGRVTFLTPHVAPFQSRSATYQQVHDVSTMGAPVIVMRGLGVRPHGIRTVRGRSWDLRLAMSQTKAAHSLSLSAIFSHNLVQATTRTVFGTASTFQRFHWPDFTVVQPFQPAFTVPFQSPFVYDATRGNLLWEWRHRNASSITSMPTAGVCSGCDAGSVLASQGTGCTATGRAAAATANMNLVTWGRLSSLLALQVGLSHAPPYAQGMLALGLVPTTAPVGWCAPVIQPVLLLPMQADLGGRFTRVEPLSRLSGSLSFRLYAQFGFRDAGLPAGIGLTDVAGYQTPRVPGGHGISRAYKAVLNGTSNGDEAATSGASQQGRGLVVGWLQ